LPSKTLNPKTLSQKTEELFGFRVFCSRNPKPKKNHLALSDDTFAKKKCPNSRKLTPPLPPKKNFQKLNKFSPKDYFLKI
jgi:hypothetical protein